MDYKKYFGEVFLIINKNKTSVDTARMVELRPGEIIVSEDDVGVAFHKAFPLSNQNSLDSLIEAFGFKKDDAE